MSPFAWRALMATAAAAAPVAADAQVWRLHQPHVLGASLDLAVVTADPASALAAARAARIAASARAGSGVTAARSSEAPRTCG